MKDLLLEIGTEELPARFVAPALNELRQTALQRLGGILNPEEPRITVVGTPRRLALLIEGLPDKSKARTQENLGPAVGQAKDAAGNWTPAAQGFARSQGIALDKLETRKTERGERLCAVHHFDGEPTAKLLPQILPEIIRQIPFPKNMVWEPTRFSFARPIRSIVALYGTQVVKFEIAGVKSGRKTTGLAHINPKLIDISAPARYVGILRDKCVLVDPAERQDIVKKQSKQLVRTVHGDIAFEQHGALLEEVTQLVEHPVAILGRFQERFLSLPKEVLITSMKKHQKFFPVYKSGDGSDALLPQFVGIRNGISENQAVVREGYERVLAARLADAAFFYEQDQKTPLDQCALRLKTVVFQEKLGTVWEKSERVIQLTGWLSDRLNQSREVSHRAARIAYLAKADLVTAMVGEFPELQGVMGRIYTAAAGENWLIAEGIEQHYWPLTADGKLPTSPEAALVSLAEKLETLCGNFLIGQVPTGSQDPYGLRRAAIGILRILKNSNWTLDVPSALRQTISLFAKDGKNIPQDTAPVLASLNDFLKQRWAALMESRGIRFDEIKAVLGALCADGITSGETGSSTPGSWNVTDAETRLMALHQIRKHPNFAPLSISFKRASNILSQAKQKGIGQTGAAVDPEILKDPAEQGLFNTLRSVEEETAPLLDDQKYVESLQGFVRLKDDVDAFFEKVMVMAPEERLRDNRLALLARLSALFHRVADFSLLQDVPTGKQ
ncbi:MAG TPA: glycine--tRNA ligase subunit beta [Elusimicrobiota bacterium]|nr:glycine--tRNA ligase subunit beta [Elusimicrobiota bacterium]